jgi:hypothetical protein
MRLKNYASLVFDKSGTAEMVKKCTVLLENYGLVKTPQVLMASLTEKTIKNYGKIKPIEKLAVGC